MTCFCHFLALFDQEAPFFDQKKFSLFSSTFSPFSHHGECGPHLFSQRKYRPTSYQVVQDLCKFTQRQICFSAFFAKQGLGQGPRTVALRANSSSVYRELTRRVIIVIVIEKGKREFVMFACVSVCVCVEGKGKGRGGRGGVVVRCAVLCVWTLCLWCDVCVCDV